MKNLESYFYKNKIYYMCIEIVNEIYKNESTCNDFHISIEDVCKLLTDLYFKNCLDTYENKFYKRKLDPKIKEYFDKALLGIKK